MQVFHGHSIEGFEWVGQVLKVWRDFGQPLLKVEHVDGEFVGLSGGSSKQLCTVLEKCLVGFDRRIVGQSVQVVVPVINIPIESVCMFTNSFLNFSTLSDPYT